MSNVIVYSDLHRIFTEGSDIVVKRIEDYVDTYKNILEAVYNQQSLTVVVQNQICLNYLSKMQVRYSEQIEIKVNSPRERFQELTKISIPDYITEDDIVQDQLFHKMNEILFNTAMSFEDNILNHYIGSYFTNLRFPFSKIVEFLKSLDLSLLNSNKGTAIFRKVYKRRLKLWQENCYTDSEKNIMSSFFGGYEALRTKLVQYLILKGYPKNLIQEMIGELAKDFEKQRIKDAPFIIKGMDTIDIQRNIKIFLNEGKITGLNHEDIVHKIECLSGLFDEELQYVYRLLRENQAVLDASILQKVRSKFKNGSEIDILFQEKLDSIIPPAKVVNPEKIDNINDWILWASGSYLPYKFWLEANDAYDDEVDKYASIYGDWIFNHYDSLISSENRMLHKTIANLSSHLKDDEISFVVIIDNFNYKYAQICKECFIDKGFSTTMDQPMISMIPTETSVSKTAFFSGQPFNTEDKNYESMCREWETFIGGNVEYLSDVGKVDGIHENKAKLYILNYLSVDKILHESQNNSALPIGYRIQEELRAMINKVVNFSKRLGVENKIKVYFISDHGSTKISGNQQNLIDPKYYKSKAEDCAYRVIALKDEKFDIYKDSIGHLCYVLNRHHYGIKENYLIAKGYNRFMKTDLSFYVHGGITPEENIIPLLKFERTSVKLIQPEMLLRENEFRYSTIGSIHITIKNHNEYSIDNVEISVLNTNIHWEQGTYIISGIEKESQVDICLDKIRLTRASTEQELLNLKIRFNFLGKECEQNYEFSIKIKSIQENKFNFDDLL